LAATPPPRVFSRSRSYFTLTRRRIHPAEDERFPHVKGTSIVRALSLCLACSVLAETPAKKSAAPTPAASLVSAAASDAPVDKASAAALKKAKASYQAGQLKDAEDRLNRLVKQNGKSAAAEEALVILTDISLRNNKADQALTNIARFRRYFGASVQLPRMAYYQGQATLRLGRNAEAAKAFANAAVGAENATLYANATKGLWALVDGIHPGTVGQGSRPARRLDGTGG
jgi:predicted Zn-dependent protease